MQGVRLKIKGVKGPKNQLAIKNPIISNKSANLSNERYWRVLDWKPIGEYGISTDANIFWGSGVCQFVMIVDIVLMLYW